MSGGCCLVHAITGEQIAERIPAGLARETAVAKWAHTAWILLDDSGQQLDDLSRTTQFAGSFASGESPSLQRIYAFPTEIVAAPSITRDQVAALFPWKPESGEPVVRARQARKDAAMAARRNLEAYGEQERSLGQSLDARIAQVSSAFERLQRALQQQLPLFSSTPLGVDVHLLVADGDAPVVDRERTLDKVLSADRIREASDKAAHEMEELESRTASWRESSTAHESDQHDALNALEQLASRAGGEVQRGEKADDSATVPSAEQDGQSVLIGGAREAQGAAPSDADEDPTNAVEELVNWIATLQRVAGVQSAMLSRFRACNVIIGQLDQFVEQHLTKLTACYGFPKAVAAARTEERRRAAWVSNMQARLAAFEQELNQEVETENSRRDQFHQSTITSLPTTVRNADSQPRLAPRVTLQLPELR